MKIRSNTFSATCCSWLPLRPRARATTSRYATVWFPEGDTWYDWFTGKAYPGGQKPGVAKGLDEFPLFARGGWVIPMQPYTPRPATEPLGTLVLRCYPGADGADNTYTLYEDDGISDACDRGGYARHGPQLPPRGAG